MWFHRCRVDLPENEVTPENEETFVCYIPTQRNHLVSIYPRAGSWGFGSKLQPVGLFEILSDGGKIKLLTLSSLFCVYVMKSSV